MVVSNCRRDDMPATSCCFRDDETIRGLSHGVREQGDNAEALAWPKDHMEYRSDRQLQTYLYSKSAATSYVQAAVQRKQDPAYTLRKLEPDRRHD